MEQSHDLDPKLQQFADIAVAEIAVPPLRRRAPAAAPTRPPRGTLVVVTALGLVLFASGAALATGLFSEVFRIGNVSVVGSRTVTLDGARVAQLPLPRSPRLQGGWNLKQVELTMTEAWRSVDLQYGRAGSHGMGIGVWSDGISVNPTTEHIETTAVDGVPVQVEGLLAVDVGMLLGDPLRRHRGDELPSRLHLAVGDGETRESRRELCGAPHLVGEEQCLQRERVLQRADRDDVRLRSQHEPSDPDHSRALHRAQEQCVRLLGAHATHRPDVIALLVEDRI